jgi:hypothetical protein
MERRIDAWVGKFDAHPGQVHPDHLVTIAFAMEHEAAIKDHLGPSMAYTVELVSNEHIVLRPGGRRHFKAAQHGRLRTQFRGQHEPAILAITPAFEYTLRPMCARLITTEVGRTIVIELPKARFHPTEFDHRAGSSEARHHTPVGVEEIRAQQQERARRRAAGELTAEELRQEAWECWDEMDAPPADNSPIEILVTRPGCDTIHSIDRREIEALLRPHETQWTVDAWQTETFAGEHRNILMVGVRMNKEMSELLSLLSHEADFSPEEFARRLKDELGDMQIFLDGLASRRGVSLQEARTDKMRVNRQRRWGKAKDGANQHIDEKAA